MRPKTLRSYKRTMRAYSTGFGFRSPYQILLDGDFCQAGLEQKIYLKEELPTILSDNTRPLVTECTLQELRDKGSAFTGAVLVAKRFERRRCKHRTPVPSAQCIKEIIAKDNPHNYCVASQDPELRKALREIPGVPLLHIKQNFIVLEPLTQVTRDEIQKREYEKTLPSAKEAEKLKTAKLVVGDKPPEEVAAAAKEEPKPKKKKVKGPNPLSVKKKKKKNPPPPPSKKKDGKVNERKQVEPKKDAADSNEGEAKQVETSAAQPNEKDTSEEAKVGEKRKESESTNNVEGNEEHQVKDGEAAKKKRKRNRKKKASSHQEDSTNPDFGAAGSDKEPPTTFTNQDTVHEQP